MRWKGKVDAWGMWFPPGEGTASRLLAEWSDGVRLWVLHGGTLLVFPAERSTRGEMGAALVILALGRGWSSWSGSAPQADEIHLYWAGEVSVHRFSSLRPLDLSTLWDSGDLRYIEGKSPDLPAVGEPKVGQTSSQHVREVLLAVPEAAPEQKEWLRRRYEPKSERPRGNPLLGFFDLIRSQWDNRENQRYIQNMMRFFEQKNWSQALRHAIPLSQENRAALGDLPAVLKARESLEFTPPGPAGSRIEAGNDAFAMLSEIYRRAHYELLKQGRVEEAAFVLAELLESSYEAVELLAAHGLYEQAARLATIKGLPAPMQVRLWFLAKRVDTALLLARTHFAHAEALQALERTHPDLVPVFRRAWAEDLVGAGRLGEALVAGWPVRQAIPQYRSWLELALQAEDLAACQALALAASDEALCEELDVPQRLSEWFSDHGLLTLERRRAVLQLLARERFQSCNPALRAWANRTAREVMKGAGSPFVLGDAAVLARLVELSGDLWLKADVPSSLPSFAGKLFLWTEKIDHHGQLPLYDVAPIGDGRTLLALGQAGLIVLSARGAVAQRFAEPVYHLVAPLEGDVFLTLAPGWTGTFQAGRLRPGIRTEIDGFAQNHDGYHWLVWRGNRLYQIDLQALVASGEWRALEKREYSSPVVSAAVGKREATVLVDTDLHRLAYPHLSTALLSSYRSSGEVLLTPEKGYPLFERNSRLMFKEISLVYRGEIVAIEHHPPFGVVTSRDGLGLTICFFALKEPKKQFVLNLPGSSLARTRSLGSQTYICDDRGRLLVADLRAQTWLGKFFL